MTEQMVTANTETSFDSEVVEIKRTTKVVKGGRKFNFKAIVVVGDRNGKIGWGKGDGNEVADAIRKATDNARRNMHKVDLNGSTLHYQIISEYGATKVLMKPAVDGTGIIAGGAMRAIFKLLGVQNVLAKTIGSPSPINVIRATMRGLTNMPTPEMVAEKRGKSVEQIYEGSHA